MVDIEQTTATAAAAPVTPVEAIANGIWQLNSVKKNLVSQCHCLLSQLATELT